MCNIFLTMIYFHFQSIIVPMETVLGQVCVTKGTVPTLEVPAVPHVMIPEEEQGEPQSSNH